MTLAGPDLRLLRYAIGDMLMPDRRRTSQRRATAIAGLRGDAFVAAANAAARVRRNVTHRFSYDRAADLYVCEDEGIAHRFAHPRRIVYFVDGLAARGRKLAGEYLLDQVPLRDGDHVVDVGANVGDLSLALRHLDVSVRVTAFEPSPREFAALGPNLANRRHVRDPDARQVALWSEDGEDTVFYLKSDSADSTLLEIEAYDSTIRVATRRLDSELAPRRYRLLKLEAEGAEPEVLEGAEGVIGMFDYVSVDGGFERGLRQESTLPRVAEQLMRHGFEFVAIGRRRLVALFRNRAGVSA